MRRLASILLWVVAALVACGPSRDRLLSALRSPRADERARAVRELAGKGNPDDVVLLAQAARDPVALVRAEAAEALGRARDSEVVDVLGDLSDDQDEAVQAKAAAALAGAEGARPKEYLYRAYGQKGRS